MRGKAFVLRLEILSFFRQQIISTITCMLGNGDVCGRAVEPLLDGRHHCTVQWHLNVYVITLLDHTETSQLDSLFSLSFLFLKIFNHSGHHSTIYNIKQEQSILHTHTTVAFQYWIVLFSALVDLFCKTS